MYNPLWRMELLNRETKGAQKLLIYILYVLYTFEDATVIMIKGYEIRKGLGIIHTVFIH